MIHKWEPHAREVHAKADFQIMAVKGGGVQAEISFDDDMIRFS
ncbi:hypothetical protein SAMN06295888_1473 [Desulfonatronum zhilinae]|nr:hypothetical protein SAMN06295888_1473 [Desulfonatronum zhilinae]